MDSQRAVDLAGGPGRDALAVAQAVPDDRAVVVADGGLAPQGGEAVGVRDEATGVGPEGEEQHAPIGLQLGSTSSYDGGLSLSQAR